MLPDVGRPKHRPRLLLARVVRSILLYASPVWAETLINSKRRKQVNSVYWLMTLRFCTAFRTVLDEAVPVVTGMVTVDIQKKKVNM